MMHEAQMHERNCFLTLTYDQEHLPKGGSLDLRHWQLFAKALRNAVGPFRFFQCGEYGERSGRPHYHAALFGLDFHDARSFVRTTPNGDRLYRSDLVDAKWGRGICRIGELTFDSAAYVARYITKKMTGPNADPFHYVDYETGVVREPERATMSLKPGIGEPWFSKFADDVYPSDEVIVNGKRCAPPKYYDVLRERTHPEQMQEIKNARAVKSLAHAKDLTPERLRVREEVRILNQKFWGREPADYLENAR